MYHIVLFKLDAEKLKKEFGGQKLNEACQKHMKGQIPGLLEVFIGERNIHPWSGYADATQGYTHALVSRHDTVENLKIYATHPKHVAFQSRLKKCFTGPPIRMEMNESKL